MAASAQLFAGLLRWRLGWRYLVVVAAMPVLTAGVALASGTLDSPADGWVSVALTYLMFLAVGAVTANLWEETVWGGFVQGRLMARHGLLAGSLLTAVPVFLIHLPLAFETNGWSGTSWQDALVTWGVLLLAAPFQRYLIGILLIDTRRQHLGRRPDARVHQRSRSDGHRPRRMAARARTDRPDRRRRPAPLRARPVRHRRVCPRDHARVRSRHAHRARPAVMKIAPPPSTPRQRSHPRRPARLARQRLSRRPPASLMGRGISPGEAAGEFRMAFAQDAAGGDVDLVPNLGLAALYIGDDTVALDAYGRFIAHVRQAGAPVTILYGLARRAAAEIATGDWPSAAAGSAEAWDLARTTGQDSLGSLPVAWLTLLAALRGDQGEFRQNLTEFARPTRARDVGLTSVVSRDVILWAKAVGAPDPPTALHHLEQITHPMVRSMSALDHIEAAAARTADSDHRSGSTSSRRPPADPGAVGGGSSRSRSGAPGHGDGGGEPVRERARHARGLPETAGPSRTQLAFGECLRRS